MSLDIFTRTYNLKIHNSNNPLEDFLTEILGSIFTIYPDFLFDFFDLLDINYNIENKFIIRTQFRLNKLYHHHSDSIPDLVVLSDDLAIFVESKISSGEGPNQLRRYAEQLSQKFGGGYLVYLTKAYKSKQEKVILKDLDNVKFKQIRWLDIYHLLQKHKNRTLIKQVISFMEHQHLDTASKFSPLDIIAISNFSRVKKMIDETLFGEVEEKYRLITGGKGQESVKMNQLRDKDRYIFLKWMENKTWIGLGYWMNSFVETKDYPEIKFVVEVSPTSPMYNEIKNIMKKITDISESNWESKNLEVPNTWSSIYTVKSLRHIMQEEDHIKSIKEFFLSSMDEFQSIKNEFGDLI